MSISSSPFLLNAQELRVSKGKKFLKYFNALYFHQFYLYFFWKQDYKPLTELDNIFGSIQNLEI